MKHKHAEFIKAWAEDSASVQFRNKNWPNAIWMPSNSSSVFDYDFCEFRMTPKPEYRYFHLHDKMHDATGRRDITDNIRATFIEGKLTAVELITEGDGK
jgi:hypothetical protein